MEDQTINANQRTPADLSAAREQAMHNSVIGMPPFEEAKRNKKRICLVCEKENTNTTFSRRWMAAWINSDLDYIPNLCSHCAIIFAMVSLGGQLTESSDQRDKLLGNELFQSGCHLMLIDQMYYDITTWSIDRLGGLQHKEAELKKQLMILRHLEEKVNAELLKSNAI